MAAIIEKLYQPTMRPDIEALEKQFSVSFPKAYIDFLLLYNGGKPRPDVVQIKGWHGQSSAVYRLFGIGVERKFENVARMAEMYHDRMPITLFPIGKDPGGNLFCIGLEGKLHGRIYFWDHEDELDEEGNSRMDFGNVYEIAPDFNRFLDSLGPMN